MTVRRSDGRINRLITLWILANHRQALANGRERGQRSRIVGESEKGRGGRSERRHLHFIVRIAGGNPGISKAGVIRRLTRRLPPRPRHSNLEVAEENMNPTQNDLSEATRRK